MDDHNECSIEELIQSVERGEQAEGYAQWQRKSQRFLAGYYTNISNPGPREPALLEDEEEGC